MTRAGHGLRRGKALGPPPETDGYTPGAELDRFVRLRDCRCRFPGCRRRARGCDLDHRREWPDGPTAHHNLCCLCEHHHRLRHQAPGWRFDGADDGGLAITMPNGEVLSSHCLGSGRTSTSRPTDVSRQTDAVVEHVLWVRCRAAGERAPRAG